MVRSRFSSLLPCLVALFGASACADGDDAGHDYGADPTDDSTETGGTDDLPDTCGDGVLDEGEACDDGPNNGAGHGWCNEDCTGIEMAGERLLHVATWGDDTWTGGPEDPLLTIEAAMSIGEGADILVDRGDYALVGPLALVSGISLHGGYDGSQGWIRSEDFETRLEISGPLAVSAVDLTDLTVLSRLTIVGGHAVDASATAYGVLAAASDGLTIEGCTIVAGDGADGVEGASVPGSADDGGTGQVGEPGCEDSSGTCSTCSRPNGGDGGTSTCGAGGGNGGRPGNNEDLGSAGLTGAGGTAGGPGTPAEEGDWDTLSQYWGGDGEDGVAGADGAAGSASFTDAGYVAIAGGDGQAGTNGDGGGGGGGGGGGSYLCDSWGGAGGGGGAGGCGGAGGGGATGGGSTFAIYVWNSDVRISDSVLATGRAGHGGDGGSGQLGGMGAEGGHGSKMGTGNNYGGGDEQDDASNGGRGGWGGNGGGGGFGGGGAGGSVIGVLIGGDSEPELTEITYEIGDFGFGGGSGGNPGPDGIRLETYEP